MAVTKIWPVKGRLDAVIRYAGNEEKTRLPDLTGLSAGKDDLSDVLLYAANDAKTSKESQLFVSGVNCVPEIARQQMELTKQQFGKTGGTVAFHAYQSFHPGEVTPEQCHAIGVELAKRVWGDRFQVLVATHLNTDCCHNHFVINSVSFVDGKRYNDCKKTYRTLQDASDELCREQGLSVVDKKDAHRVPRNLYLAEKAGEPTRYNVMRQDIDLAILRSETPRDLPRILRKMGYEVDFNPNHKYPTIKLPHDRRAVRFKTLGEEYTPASYGPAHPAESCDGDSQTHGDLQQAVSSGASPLPEAAAGLPQGYHGSVRNLLHLPVLLLPAGQAAHHNTQLPPTSSSHEGGLPPLGGN